MSSQETMRVLLFLAVLIVLFIAETIVPKRKPAESRFRRNGNNLLIHAVNSTLFPLLPAAVAAWTFSERMGVLNLLSITGVFHIISALLLLDLVIWFQHYLFHRVPALWRLHLMHHADIGIDLTTGVRFHPLEILISVCIKCTAVYLIGATPFEVLLFGTILNSAALFNHANIRLPEKLDKALRRFIVTPDFHRVHHSVQFSEMNTNFGFNIPWWDYLFNTYTPQPEKGHTDMTIGLSIYRHPSEQSLPKMLTMPFRDEAKPVITANNRYWNP